MDFTKLEISEASISKKMTKESESKLKNFKNIFLSKEFPIFSIAFLIIFATLTLVIPNKTLESGIYGSLSSSLIKPGQEHLFGTDLMGRDILMRIIHGGKISLLVGVGSAFMTLVIGVLYGGIAGYIGGRTDQAMMRLLEIFLALPSIVIMVFIQALFGKTTVLGIIIAISITSWMSTARLVRTEVIEMKNREYVLAAKVLGASPLRIFKNHIFSHLTNAITFITAISVANGIISEATLSFMGLGFPPEIPSWGTMLMDAQKLVMTGNWWVPMFPGIAVICTVFSATNIGEYIRKSNNKKTKLI